jgi:hypothetical protein
LPFQVDAQAAWRNVFVQAHSERRILESFHLCLVSFVLVILFRSSSFQLETLCSYAPRHPDLTY